MFLAWVFPDQATNQAVIWSSSNTSVATIDATGHVILIGEGNTIITVKTVDGGYTDSWQFTVSGFDITATSDVSPLIGYDYDFFLQGRNGASWSKTYTVTSNDTVPNYFPDMLKATVGWPAGQYTLTYTIFEKYSDGIVLIQV